MVPSRDPIGRTRLFRVLSIVAVAAALGCGDDDSAANAGSDGGSEDGGAYESRTDGGAVPDEPDSGAPADGGRDAGADSGAGSKDACVDACDSGATRCTDNAVEHCGVGDDGCREWQVKKKCGAKELCATSAGAAACKPGCAGDADCDGVLTAADCDDGDPELLAKSGDADCDGVLTEADCDDGEPGLLAVSGDADCDGVLTAADCDDGDPELLAVSGDADCDGVLTAADCDDGDPELLAVSGDADCDGVLTAADCDDSDSGLGAMALDMDCDGAITGHDCDDADDGVGFDPLDYDCDGIPTLLDCADKNAAIGADPADADCNGAPDIVTFEKANYADASMSENQDCISSQVCVTRGDDSGLYNAVVDSGYADGAPSDVEFAAGYVGQASTPGSWRSAIRNPTWWPFQPVAMHLVTDDLFFNVLDYRWTGQSDGGGFAWARAEATIFEKQDLADPTLAANQDCVVPGVCLTRGNSQGLYNAAAEQGFAAQSPAGTEWAPNATAQSAAGDYTTFTAATGNSPPSMEDKVMSLHVLGTDLYYDVVLSAWSTGNAGGGFKYTRSRALVVGCTDSGAANYDARATVDDGYCGDWQRVTIPSDPDTSDPANRDCLTPDVCLTRGSTEGLYNAASETTYDDGTSPAGTFWAASDTASAAYDDYTDWVDAMDGCPPCNNNQTLSLSIPVAGRAWDIVVVRFPGNDSGGGITYLRREVVLSNTCGNNTPEVGEQCDDGNSDETDGCLSNCLLPGCGNGVAESEEECDDGPANSQISGANCRLDCTLAGCGDGIVDPGEGCDDRGTSDGNGCDASCQTEQGWTCSGAPSSCDTICGDGLTLGTEQCDDGGNDSGDGCSPVCIREECGNGILDPGEGCDDRGTSDGNGCDANCQTEQGWTCSGAPSSCDTICGDGLTRGSEQCDDGGTAPGDGCSPVCIQEECGNGIVDPLDDCDDGNAVSGDGCENDCTLGCGSHSGAALGAVRASDGQCILTFNKPSSVAAARNTCHALAGELVTVSSADENSAIANFADYVGRSVWIGYSDQETEGTFEWFSGSSSTYTMWNPGEPNNSGGAEDCTEVNDSGRWNDNRCGASYPFVCETLCGNGTLDTGEVCDDGPANSNDPGSSCRTNCTTSAACGDGILDVGEDCDDGNQTDGDGCAADCTLACGAGLGADAATMSPTDGACFLLYRAAVDFDTAKNICTNAGGHLVTVSDAAENSALQDLQQSATVGTAWIGFTDSASEGTFVWLSAETPSYTNWRSGEPNNAGQAGEDCASLIEDGGWNDVNCENPLPYYCEVP